MKSGDKYDLCCHTNKKFHTWPQTLSFPGAFPGRTKHEDSKSVVVDITSLYFAWQLTVSQLLLLLAESRRSDLGLNRSGRTSGHVYLSAEHPAAAAPPSFRPIQNTQRRAKPASTSSQWNDCTCTVRSHLQEPNQGALCPQALLEGSFLPLDNGSPPTLELYMETHLSGPLWAKHSPLKKINTHLCVVCL